MLTEISHLLPDHYYRIRVRASLKHCQNPICTADSDEKVIFLECDYKCRDGRCMKSGSVVVCNGLRECLDGSDEEDCPCDEKVSFLCDNKYCISKDKRCDGNLIL